MNAPVDAGLACLALLARYHGIAVEPASLAHEFKEGGRAFGVAEILLAARKLGLKARCVRVVPERLGKTPLPAIAIDRDSGFCLLAQVNDCQALIVDPIAGQQQVLPHEAFARRWSGELILATPRGAEHRERMRFDFGWFVPALHKYRKLLVEVLAASLMLQVFALLTPLFFQVVMDKVLVHRGLTTLDVVAVGLLGVVLFEALLSLLRTYVLAHTTSRIDVELGTRLFHHLLALPLAYFEARRVGDSVARVRELENIRGFLTGQALTAGLDIVFSFVFIGMMLFYSGTLTLVVLASLPCYAALALLLTPVIRARLDEKFDRGAESQAFLVETVSGAGTVKALAAEPQFVRRWNQQLAGYIAAAFRTTTVAAFAHGGVSLVGRLVTVATLWLGARLVIDGELTVGQLIAFNMFANHVAQPVMRLAQLWSDVQQVGISVARLGDVLNAPTEATGRGAALPTVQGRIVLDRVSFRYRPDAAEALRDVSLIIEPGQVIGIVGRSGSGKSTLAKLVQRLYVPERGRVLIDGTDIALADAASLRRQIGVVLQENLLFHRTVRENIALADPAAPLEAVVRAARLAGAHDFILELPQGYDTVVGEHGATLSGGQRQRIAIARALLADPRILLFDEATSALDYESERIVQRNMQAIAAGRTVIVIAHRLSAVRDAHRIVVLDHGQIVEQGTHRELLAAEAGHYARLHRLQAGHA